MMRRIVSENIPPEQIPNQEGDLFKVIRLWNQEFPIHYGYYEQCDRENPAVDPMPIYPNFLHQPRYTEQGMPFVTKMQDICPCYSGREGPFNECGDCGYYLHGDELMGLCTCPMNRKPEIKEDAPVGSKAYPNGSMEQTPLNGGLEL